MVSVLELHLPNTLNNDFLKQYEGVFDATDRAVIYFDPQATAITFDDIITAFDKSDLQVFTETSALETYLIKQRDTADLFLLMSAGTFNRLDLKSLAEKLI